MMAVKLIPLLQVAVLLSDPSHAFPTTFGRLQRAGDPQMYPTHVYDLPQTYPDKYFYEALSYPVYYPRASKYEVYQAVLPYYYDHPSYYGYDESPDTMGFLEEEMYRDAERKQREDAQPIGQETYFEDDSDDEADVHAAFVNNLIMSQMYRDSIADTENYGKIDDFPTSPEEPKSKYTNEDDEVMALKSLAGRKLSPKPEERLRWFQKSAGRMRDLNEEKRSAELSTAQPDVTTVTAKLDTEVRGQKEEVLPRPAAPVRLPFTATAVVNNKKKDRQRRPSVYDTIKQMLAMERSLEKQNDAGDVIMRTPMRKRIVAGSSSEDMLAHQLSGLKKRE